MFEFESEWCLLFCSFYFLFLIAAVVNLVEILCLTIIFKYNHILQVLQQMDQAKKPITGIKILKYYFYDTT